MYDGDLEIYTIGKIGEQLTSKKEKYADYEIEETAVTNTLVLLHSHIYLRLFFPDMLQDLCVYHRSLLGLAQMG